MKNLKDKVKENHLMIYNFEKKIDENSLIIGTITVNNKLLNINVEFAKKINNISFSEPMADHTWFLDAIYSLKEKQNLEKALAGLFISKG